jgi:EF hand
MPAASFGRRTASSAADARHPFVTLSSGLLVLVMLLVAAAAHAQPAGDGSSAPTTVPPGVAVPQPLPAAPATADKPATPARYSAEDLNRAFSFMDGNRDGKISRDEASNFRGVSRHFDEADTNKDGFLSFDEFENGMNKSIKP